jgi:hypothetical protein
MPKGLLRIVSSLLVASLLVDPVWAMGVSPSVPADMVRRPDHFSSFQAQALSLQGEGAQWQWIVNIRQRIEVVCRLRRNWRENPEFPIFGIFLRRIWVPFAEQNQRRGGPKNYQPGKPLIEDPRQFALGHWKVFDALLKIWRLPRLRDWNKDRRMARLSDLAFDAVYGKAMRWLSFLGGHAHALAYYIALAAAARVHSRFEARQTRIAKTMAKQMKKGVVPLSDSSPAYAIKPRRRRSEFRVTIPYDGLKRKVISASFHDRKAVLVHHWDEIIQTLGGPEVLQEIDYLDPSKLAEMLEKVHLARRIFEKVFGVGILPVIFRRFLPLAHRVWDSDPFVIDHLVSAIIQIKPEQKDSLLASILNVQGSPFEKAGIFLWLRSLVKKTGSIEPSDPEYAQFKREGMKFLNSERPLPEHRKTFGILLSGNYDISEALIEEAIRNRDQTSIRLLATSASLAGTLWSRASESERPYFRRAIIQSFLENAYPDIIELQSYWVAAKVGKFRFTDTHRIPEMISTRLVEKFLEQAQIGGPKQMTAADLSPSDLFRLAPEKFITTPIYMVTRAYRGGNFSDTEDARDIALGLVPYGFARGGMTIMYVLDPAIHEIDLASIAEENNRQVRDVREPDRPLNYTYIDVPVNWTGYADSIRVDWNNAIEVYKQVARRHDRERRLKAKLFDAIEALRKARSPASAVDPLKGIEALVAALREAPKDSVRFFHGKHVYEELSEEFFGRLRSLAKLGDGRSACDLLAATRTMRILTLEKEAMQGTYEDYPLDDAPMRSEKLSKLWLQVVLSTIATAAGLLIWSQAPASWGHWAGGALMFFGEASLIAYLVRRVVWGIFSDGAAEAGFAPGEFGRASFGQPAEYLPGLKEPPLGRGRFVKWLRRGFLAATIVHEAVHANGHPGELRATLASLGGSWWAGGLSLLTLPARLIEEFVLSRSGEDRSPFPNLVPANSFISRLRLAYRRSILRRDFGPEEARAIEEETVASVTQIVGTKDIDRLLAEQRRMFLKMKALTMANQFLDGLLQPVILKIAGAAVGGVIVFFYWLPTFLTIFSLIMIAVILGAFIDIFKKLLREFLDGSKLTIGPRTWWGIFIRAKENFGSALHPDIVSQIVSYGIAREFYPMSTHVHETFATLRDLKSKSKLFSLEEFGSHMINGVQAWEIPLADLQGRLKADAMRRCPSRLKEDDSEPKWSFYYGEELAYQILRLAGGNFELAFQILDAVGHGVPLADAVESIHKGIPISYPSVSGERVRRRLIRMFEALFRRSA